MAENTTQTIRLLVVSKEPAVLGPLWTIGECNSWQVENASSGWDAMERVQSGVAPHLLLLDLPRGDGDSLHVLRWLRRLRPDLPVIVLCYPEDTVIRTEATRLGAEEILVRPFDEQQLEFAIRRYVDAETSEADLASENVEQMGQDEFFVSASPIMQKLRAQAELLAQADVPVFILGEAGTGKDTVAGLIHKLSVRSGFKFLKVNCAAMPGDLLEIELFGNHRPSVKNGGRVNRGKFELGERGAIFLDEIAEMPAGLQSRLLQVLQNNEFRRPGSEDRVPVDVRILAATSANLDRALAEKKLREDLYYRLSAFTVRVPPLRQRKEEIVILLRCLMHKLAKHYGLPPREFSAGVLDTCLHYSWPGNLRELETFVKRYLVAGDRELTLSEVDLGKADKGTDNFSDARSMGMAATSWAEAEARQAPPAHKSLKSLIQSIKWEAERNAIGAALEKTGWNRKAAARLLKVSYRTLLYKIDQYHMSASESALSPPPVDRYSAPEVKGNGKLS